MAEERTVKLSSPDRVLYPEDGITKGDVFGPVGANDNQVRGVIETGFIFGNNVEKKP